MKLRPGVRRFAFSVLGLLIALALYVGLFALNARSAEYFVDGNPRNQLAWAGAYHVHSNRSDGRGSVGDIAAAARSADLAFVILTDHNQPPLPPRFEQGVLLIFGTEISTRWGHLVSVGSSRALTPEEVADHPVQRVLELGGMAILAHPLQKKMPWTDWDAAQAATGLELYSADTMLRQALRSPVTRLLPAVGSYLTNPMHALLWLAEGQPELDDRLRQLTTGSPKVALCGVDAHGFPPYVESFKALQLNVPHPFGERLSANPEQAASAVLRALAGGQTYCVFRPLGDASGFEIEGMNAKRREAAVGVRLHVVLPGSASADSRLHVTGSGRLLSDGRTVLLEQPGAVQIEVWRSVPRMMFDPEPRPWIVPSPIRVVAAPY